MTTVKINQEDNFDELFDNIVCDNEVFIDVGGYNGDTVTKALQINPNLSILVIEPIKFLCDEMKHKFANNPNITIINKAAFNRKCSLIFNEYDGGFRGLSTLQKTMTELRPKGMFTNHIAKYEVRADTIDNMLLNCNIDTIDYIKIDTEGSEEQVLQGFTKYHIGTRFHVESHITNLENILQTLLEMGVDIETITVMRDGNIKEHVVGSVIGEFAKNGSEIIIR
jgi:FkbM family methyltransferase